MRQKKKYDWIKFTTETGLEAGYRYDEEIQDYRMKLFTGMPRGHWYYSSINEIGAHFDEKILPTLTQPKNQN